MDQSENPTGILIIDDDPSFQLLVRKKLERIVARPFVKLCSSLKETREFLAVNDKPLDLIILDQHLPDGQGLELLKDGLFSDAAVLAVSSDKDPQIPGSVVGAGATFFLSKTSISDSLFDPLIRGLTDRARLNRQLDALKIQLAVLDSVKTMVSTLRHEINNPLGGVLGGAYLLKNLSAMSEDQQKAAEIIEKSGNRIKHVLDQLCNAILLDKVNKGGQEVYHVPGDKEWQKS